VKKRINDGGSGVGEGGTAAKVCLVEPKFPRGGPGSDNRWGKAGKGGD